MPQSSFPLLQCNAHLFPEKRRWPCLLFQHIVVFLKNPRGKINSCRMALSFLSLCQKFYLTRSSSVGLLLYLSICTSWALTGCVYTYIYTYSLCFSHCELKIFVCCWITVTKQMSVGMTCNHGYIVYDGVFPSPAVWHLYRVRRFSNILTQNPNFRQ